MRKLFFLLATACCGLTTQAQTAKVNWGDEFKMRKGSTDLAVIATDKDGVYLKEGHMALKGYFVVAATMRESATLVKLDKSFEEIYRNDFNKELKGKEYEDLFFLQDKLFLMASKYDKSEKTYTLYGAELNKKDGEMTGDWQEITTWNLESKRDDFNFRIDYNGDSSKMIVVSTTEGKEKNTYHLKMFDAKLKPVGKTVTITNEFEPKTFQLEDVVYATNGNIVMVGRELEYREGKKKKSKFLDFKNYVINIYKPDGSILKKMNTDVLGKWLISSKLSQIGGKELVLAAFYSDAKRGSKTNGIMVQRINSATGDVISTSNKELNTSLVDVVESDDDDDDDESKKERKEREKFEKMREDEEGFSKNYRFRNFITTKDGGVVVLAEEYNSYSYSYYVSNGTGGGGRWVYVRVYNSGNIMMSKMDAKGDINWLHVLPKQQQERIQTGSSGAGNGISLSIGSNYFYQTAGYPFYSGFASMYVPEKNKVAIVFNDRNKNANVMQMGQKVKVANRFSKTDCYYVSLDPEKGTYNRASIFSNNDIPVAMPRLGRNLNNTLYLVGKEDRILGKTKIAVGKIDF